MRLALVLCPSFAVACGRPAAGPPPPHLVPVAPAEVLPGVTAVHMELATKTPTLVFDTFLTQRARVVASVEEIVGRIR